MVRIRREARAALAVVVPAALLAAGIFAGRLHSAEWRWLAPILPELREITALDPVRAFPRTDAVLAMLEAERNIAEGRPYAAWEAVNSHVDLVGVTGPAVNLLAARAASEWGGWAQVRRVLADRPWLSDVAAGEGLFLLGRAEEELGNGSGALRAYQAYVGVGSGVQRGYALARIGRLLGEQGDHIAAAQSFARAADDVPDIGDWLRVLQVENLVAAGDPAAADVVRELKGGSAPVRARRVLLEARDLVLGAQTDRAISRLEWESRILAGEGAAAESAELILERARLLLSSSGDVGVVRRSLRDVAANSGTPAPSRAAAAELLGTLPGLTFEDELARADAFEAVGRPGAASRALRTALENGAPDSAEQRMRLAEMLFEERDYTFARPAFQHAASLLQDPEARADAELHAARSLFRSGGTARARQTAQQTALTEFRQIGDRYAGTAAAGTALFFLGDEAASNQAALPLYRRAAAIGHSPDAREALFRVGDRSLRINDTAGAIRAWEEYVSRYPGSDQTAEVAYRVAKLHERAGRTAQARAMYTAATLAEPTSYYALRAGEHLGISAITPILSEPRPWAGLASDPAEAAAVLARMDLLENAGLAQARGIEYQAALRRFARRPLALLTLAEGVRDRNDPVESIRLGRQLLSLRGGEWDERVLRLVYPFPYRQLITAESRRVGIDAYLYAGLVRQESTFRPAIRSRVGATGLGQIMPATGRWLAPSLGIRDYDDFLLTVPEVNLRMGTSYLSDLLRRYDGAADLALAGYNAGPGRADRWRREFNYGRDTDAFREAIPFAETRGYVTVVLRNAAVYRALYGGSASGNGLTAD